ncbi:MAG: type VI secretion system baseplate subunit TssG [Acidobacteriota bacterium]
MAAPSGTGDPVVEFAQTGLGEILSREPYRFEFFQAVRLLSRAFPGREPVGRLANPQQEVLRFRAHASMAFPASEIQGLALSSGAPHSMIVNFMGLTGPMGALPLYYTELVIQRVRIRDTAMRDFLDTFNHRIVSLFYQAWEKYRFTIAYERGEQDRFSHCLLDLVGLGTPGLQRRQAVLDDALIYYSGLLALHTRSAQALTQILMDYFEVPAEVVQLTGGWYSLDRPSQCCFENANAYSEQLGVGTVVGDEIWDPQSAAKVVLGPLRLRQYLDFLPNGTAYRPLQALLKFFSNAQVDFEIQLVLGRDEVPPCELGGEGEVAPQLGWITWVKSVPMKRDPGDTILRM